MFRWTKFPKTLKLVATAVPEKEVALISRSTCRQDPEGKLGKLLPRSGAS